MKSIVDCGYMLVITPTETEYILGNKKQKHSAKAQCSNEEAFYNKFSNINTSSKDEFINKLNEITKRNRLLKAFYIFSIICLCVGFIGLSSSLFYLILMITGLAIFVIVPHRFLIDLYCNIKNIQLEKFYQNILTNTKNLALSNKLWELISIQSQSDWKDHAGAHSSVNRIKVCVDNRKALFSSNNQIPIIKSKNKKLIFLPNIMLVYQNNKWIQLDWKLTDLKFTTTVFIESEQIPADAKIIDYTYLHPNKHGGADKRYTNNPKLPKCEYAVIGFGINSTNILIMASNIEYAVNFYNALQAIRDFIISLNENKRA